MTVLNIPSDGYFNVLIAIYRTLNHYGSMERDRLLNLCGPGLSQDDKMLKHTLSRWIQLGLIIDGEQVDLSPEAKGYLKKSNETSIDEKYQLPFILRRYVFKENNNERFWDRDGTLCADLTRGLAFLLAQDIYSLDLASHQKVQEIEQKQVKETDRRILQNDVRWNGLRTWGVYLGFIQPGLSLTVDPTRAIQNDLPLIFGQSSTLPAGDFMQRVGDILPVLDGGYYRKKMEEILDEAYWHRPDRPDKISTSLSRALWRLSNSSPKHIRLESRADAVDGRELQKSNGESWQRFTHVVYLGTGEK